MLVPMAVMAQSGTNSPYSQYGIGVLSDQATGFNRGMAGVGIAFNESNQVNPLNPASYGNVDSLSFIFDAGVSLQLTNFQEGSRKLNARNANFEYVVAAFRVAKHFGMSFGIMPYSNIGYNYSSSANVSDNNTTVSTTQYTGNGGVRTLYVGAGWMPVKGLAIGVNVGYLWGNCERSIVNSYSDAYVNTLSRYYTSEPFSYKLDLGVQYTQKLGRKDNITIGAIFSPGHSLSGGCNMDEISTNSQTGVTDTVSVNIGRGMFLPNTYGVGVTYSHTNKWRVGLDYNLQQWSEKPFPVFANGKYEAVKGALLDRQRIALGGEFAANPLSRTYINRVRVRAGVSYATPYIKVNGQDGPKEISATIGLGLPITNSYNNRSILNVSGQWVRTSAPGMIKENSFRINLGLTFNERWFMKWKLE